MVLSRLNETRPVSDRIGEYMNKGLVAVIALVLIGGVSIIVMKATSSDQPPSPVASTAMHGKDAGAPAREAGQIVVPEFTPVALAGQEAFTEYCAACHGANAAGTAKGPTFIHKIYEPSHHADYAFQMAAKNGVNAHHWRFGNMKPVPGITSDQVQAVAVYVRELQRANGIY
jgi:cytochrome c5